MQIKEDDLKGHLDVISQLWEILEESHQKFELQEEKKKELEEKWNDEKLKRRQVEKVTIKLVTSKVVQLVC